MQKKIEVQENSLHMVFNITEDGRVLLSEFTPEGLKKPEHSSALESRNAGNRIKHLPTNAIEIQETGKSTRDSHGYKLNMSSASLEYLYDSHLFTPLADGKELTFTLKSADHMKAVWHIRMYNGIPVIRSWVDLVNEGTQDVGLEYVSSFLFRNLCGNGTTPYYKKTNLYIPHNSWDNEAQWEKRSLEDLSINGMAVDGFNTPGFGQLRYSYGSRSSWSSGEYLPMGFVEDTETGETYCFQIESSGQWIAEYGSDPESHFYLALSGPTEQDHGWWKNLKPGMTFTTVPTAFGVVDGNISDAAAALTMYRRAMRRPNADDEKLNVVFNDYMNCLMGDPTEEREKAIIDKAAKMGCEYYCMDCGWYDKGYWWDRIGEWMESPERFPNGMKVVCDYARSKGMVMGLWLEIEAMGTACELAGKLPDDWFVCRHGKRYIDKRRYLLDFRNPEVRKYCMDVVDRLISDYGVGYFKVDYNVTMGYGSDLHSDSCSDAILEHYTWLYRWYEEIFKKHPDLVVENCGSGGQRMDYGILRLLSLQSTSDQTDYIYNSYIGASVATAVTPEQAGMWVYPYEDEEEHVIYNMVNGLLLRPYISGMVWKLGESSISLMQEGIQCYKDIREDLKSAVPEFPLGLCNVRDEALAYGLKKDKTLYLSVMLPCTSQASIPIRGGKRISDVSVIYPSDIRCEFTCEDGILNVKMPQKVAARLFKITFR